MSSPSQNSSQEEEEQFCQQPHYPFKTLEEFQRRQQQYIQQVTYRLRNDKAKHDFLAYQENRRQIKEDKELIEIIKSRTQDFNDIVQKDCRVKTFTGYKDKYIQKLIRKKQSKEFKQTKHLAAKQLEENILQQIDELNRKNADKFSKFTQQIQLYNQFYSIFIYEKENQFAECIANHELGVDRHKVYTQKNATVFQSPATPSWEEFTSMDCMDKDFALELNRHLQAKIAQAKHTDMNAEQKKYFEAIRNGELKKLEMMLEVNGSLVECLDGMHMNGLHVAILRKQCSMIELLINKGIDVSHQDIANRSPLELANEQEPTFTINKIKSMLNDALKAK